ncbi:MAG: glycosyltransferase family 4 protein [Methylococcales bacterium]|nr:glycosyltransferase family 4 protein [Methylococcales bacterium]
MPIFIWIVLFALFASLVLTGLLRRYALAASLLDIPNERSSHSLPTPRGGGVAIVIIFLLGIVLLFKLGLLATATLWAFLGAGAWVAVVGFIDDHQHIPARWRLLAHFIAAAYGLFWLGLPTLFLFGIDLTVLGYVLAVFYLVWMLNLYNFMDGIDGLASIEAITVCVGGVLLTVLGTGVSNQAYVLLLLIAAVTGFLIWNYPPAKIFMGDAGSGFLGLILGLFSLQAAWQAPQFFWSWLILLGVFIVDATWTLVQRFLRGEKVYEAHRSHAYQFASRYYSSHTTVSLTVAAINIGWLLPMALWVGLGSLNGLLGLVIAYLPLLFLAVHFKAGLAE